MPHLPTKKPKNVLVVCHGNICRSPLAGAVIAKIIGQDRVRDRGLSGKSGQLAAKKVRDHAAQHGYDLSHHRSSPITEADVAWADLVLYMDAGNFKRLVDQVPRCKLRGLGSYVGMSRIADPNYLPQGPQLAALLDLVVQAATIAGEAFCD